MKQTLGTYVVSTEFINAYTVTSITCSLLTSSISYCFSTCGSPGQKAHIKAGLIGGV